MKRFEKIRAFDQIKVLADPRRMRILRLLMANPATLTDLGEVLNQTPAWIQHHIRKLEVAGLVELSEVRRTGKVTEKFYSAKARAFLLQELIFPDSDKPTLIFSGSHDLAVEIIAESLKQQLEILILSVGSLDGLINLRQGLCQISGVHLHDESGEFNLPYVRRIFPDQKMDIFTLAHRTQGLIVPNGNPKALRSIADLAQKDLRFINRNSGSGTRLWLDMELKQIGLSGAKINGYLHEANTHQETARAVASNQADAAVGLQAAAEKYGLGFIPLYQERYDVIFPHRLVAEMEIFLNYLQSAVFRRQLANLSGYQSSSSGMQLALP